MLQVAAPRPSSTILFLRSFLSFLTLINTFKITLALVLTTGLDTAAFAQIMPGTTNGTGTTQTTPGTMRSPDGTMQTTPGTMRDGSMRDGTRAMVRCVMLTALCKPVTVRWAAALEPRAI